MDNLPSTPGDRLPARRRRLAPLGFAAAGLIGGVIVSTTMGAQAATTATPSASASSDSGSAATTPGSTDSTTAPEATEPKGSGHGTEATITGTNADKVKAAVLVKYPAAKVNLVESDSRGGYEAEIVTAAGASIHVSVSATFVVGEVRGGPGGGGPGGHDGMRGHSNTDPAHEAGESAARTAEEKAADATATATTMLHVQKLRQKLDQAPCVMRSSNRLCVAPLR